VLHKTYATDDHEDPIRKLAKGDMRSDDPDIRKAFTDPPTTPAAKVNPHLGPLADGKDWQWKVEQGSIYPSETGQTADATKTGVTSGTVTGTHDVAETHYAAGAAKEWIKDKTREMVDYIKHPYSHTREQVSETAQAFRESDESAPPGTDVESEATRKKVD